MISNPSSAAVYTDFQGLARLRAEARKNSPEAIRETARQFEALFVQMMLKAMREASPGGGLFDSDQVGFYTELYDRQISLHMVQGQGLGIADTLTSQLGGQPESPVPVPESSPAMWNIRRQALTAMKAAVFSAIEAEPPRAQVTEPDLLKDITHETSSGDISSVKEDWRPHSAAEFVRGMWNHARRGAEELGVMPEVLVAQSALETGWGKKIIRHPDGRSSFNLFNIKADRSWNGERVTVSTLEYEGGVASKQRASFRAYDSIDAAVSDYVDFLRSNPRYRAALEQAADPIAYLRGLHDAGYATDPQYVEKIQAILSRGTMEKRVTDMEVAQHVPPT